MSDLLTNSCDISSIPLSVLPRVVVCPKIRWMSRGEMECRITAVRSAATGRLLNAWWTNSAHTKRWTRTCFLLDRIRRRIGSNLAGTTCVYNSERGASISAQAGGLSGAGLSCQLQFGYKRYADKCGLITNVGCSAKGTRLRESVACRHYNPDKTEREHWVELWFIETPEIVEQVDKN